MTNLSGSAITGHGCNGWLFWSLAETPARAPAKAKKLTAKKAPMVDGIPEREYGVDRVKPTAKKPAAKAKNTTAKPAAETFDKREP